MAEQAKQGASGFTRPRQDGRLFLALVVICLVLVGGLAIVSRGAPSATQLDSVRLQTDAVGPDQGCDNFATFWTVDTGVEMPVDAIEGLTNCRLSTDGQWFVPDGVDDSLLSERSVLTANERALVEALRFRLDEDLTALDNALPDYLKESFEPNYADENLPVFGHTKRGRTDFGFKRARYQRITQAFLLSPDRILLADYIGWVMTRRATAVAQIDTACLADQDLQYLLRACNGMRGEFNIIAVPIIWDLTNPVVFEEYLVWLARSGEPLPTAPPASTAD